MPTTVYCRFRYAFAPSRMEREILLIRGVPSSKRSTFLPVNRAKSSAMTDPTKVAKTRYFSMCFPLSSRPRGRELLFVPRNIIKKESRPVKFSNFFWYTLKICRTLFVKFTATFYYKNVTFSGIYRTFFPGGPKCTIHSVCIFPCCKPQFLRRKNFFTLLFQPKTEKYSAKMRKIFFRTFCGDSPLFQTVLPRNICRFTQRNSATNFASVSVSGGKKAKIF